jgi:hypothetical protein
LQKRQEIFFILLAFNNIALAALLAAWMKQALLEIMSQGSCFQSSDLLLWMTFMGSIVAQVRKVKEGDLFEFFGRPWRQVDISSRQEDAMRTTKAFGFSILRGSRICWGLPRSKI